MHEDIFELYKFCPNCSHKLEIIGHSKTCSHCGKKYYFNSRPTVAVIAVNDRREYLLVQRKDEPFKNWWDIPGGFVDEDETLEDAALREFREEAGVRLKRLTYVGSFSEDYEFNDNIYHVVAAVFIARLPSESKVHVGDDAIGYKFFSKKSIPLDKVAFPNQRQFLEHYLNEK